MIKALASIKGEGAACGSGVWVGKDLNSFDAESRSGVWKLRIANGLCPQKRSSVLSGQWERGRWTRGKEEEKQP